MLSVRLSASVASASVVQVLRRDRLPRALDDGARLLDRVLAEVRARDDVGDLREQRLDLLERLLAPAWRALSNSWPVRTSTM